MKFFVSCRLVAFAFLMIFFIGVGTAQSDDNGSVAVQLNPLAITATTANGYTGRTIVTPYFSVANAKALPQLCGGLTRLTEVILIAFNETRFVTIQVKSGTMMENGHARIVNDFNKYEGVDFIVCYDVHNRRWFIFPFEELRDKKSATLSPKLHERNCDNWSLIR